MAVTLDVAMGVMIHVVIHVAGVVAIHVAHRQVASPFDETCLSPMRIGIRFTFFLQEVGPWTSSYDSRRVRAIRRSLRT